METKTTVFAVIAVIAILLGAYILLAPQPAPPAPGDYPNPLKGESASMEAFANYLISSNTVYLVEDLRGLERYPISRNNIMQCGVDFAGSEGLAGKELDIYILEEETCSASEAGGNLTTKPISECHASVASAFGKEGNAVIWIEKGYTPSIYPSGIVVRVNETYTQGMCNIQFVVPVEEPPAPAAANGTTGGAAASTGEEGTESVTWETTPEIPTDSGSGPEEAVPEETVPETEAPAPIPPHAD